jgi:hypothetical protein
MQRWAISTRCTAIGLAAFLSWSGNCASQTVEPGPVRVGDRWSYDVKDDATGELKHSVTFVVIEVNAKEITARMTMRGKDRPRTFVFAPDWGRIDDSVWRYQPSEIGVRMPLKVGKEWRAEANAQNMQTGIALRAAGVAKVVGQETVTTPAGTFDTFRVEATVRQVNTKDQTKSGTITHIIWYAPAVNRWVKRKNELRFEGRLRDSVLEELTDYARKP